MLEELKKYYKFNHDDYSGNIEQFMSLMPELSLIIAMNFQIKPSLERYYLDKIDLKESPLILNFYPQLNLQSYEYPENDYRRKIVSPPSAADRLLQEIKKLK